LPEDKEKMLATIARFQSLSPEERHNFKVGRRVGIYEQLDDLNNPRKHKVTEHAIQKFSGDGGQVDEEKIYSLMERFI
jgi:hypothetical protein